ncbi:MAG: SDR family oxidoreductase [Deltaproteobacteria bacterium]|nr:SDR family oxidoreductase [Deltaproteobacteria bacterium]MBI3388055.1 SDR family oxidoreductase [Deltaproteobacteria bacterium]
MAQWWRERLKQRPWWMNALMLFCAYLAVIHIPWDFFVKPAAQDAEAWFGILLRGRWAKVTEPLHWAIYAAGAFGFWRMRAWMWPWAAVYAGQVAFGMLVWNVVYVGGARGWLTGLLSLVPFGVLTSALWRERDRFGRPRQSLRERYGDWALITGASAGIGAEFARALAQEGLSCVLTARREDRLRTLATELEQQYHVATRVVAADLVDPHGTDQLLDAIKDLQIDVFINNAGFGYAGRFDKQDTERLRAMVQVNCVAPVVLASRLLPAMRERGRGAMIVTGSIAGRQPLPRHALYAATKAFDQLFGEALWAELRGTGVDVLVLEPGPTESEFREVAGEERGTGEPAVNVVALAFDALGQQPSVISGWFNWARANALRIVPRSTMTLLAEQVVLEQTPPAMR